MKMLIVSLALVFAYSNSEAMVVAAQPHNKNHPTKPDPLPSQNVGKYKGQNSGLDWQFGIANTDRANECDVLQEVEKDFLRGRQSDVFAGFFTHDNVQNMRNHLKAKKDNWNCFTKNKVIISQVMPLLGTDEVHSIGQVLIPQTAIHKEYVQFWTEFGEMLKSTGQTNAYLRLGHEMNLGGGYPWGVPNNISAKQFVQLYQLAADTVRSVVPTVLLVWNPGKSSTVSIDTLWPGDKYVDIVGVDWYDNGSHTGGVMQTEQDWTNAYNKSDNNGPVGIGAWYAYAKKHNKPIAFPEWALKAGKGNDNRTIFVQKMFDFAKMASKEGFMAYESYYNEPGQHQIYPHSQFPQASKLYQSLWGK